MPDGHRVREREHWERVARTIPDLFGAPSTQYYRRSEIALLQRWFGDVRGKRILKFDLWNEAFNTRILEVLSGHGADCFGLDLSHGTASRAYRHARTEGVLARYAQADIRELPASKFYQLVGPLPALFGVPEALDRLAVLAYPRMAVGCWGVGGVLVLAGLASMRHAASVLPVTKPASRRNSPAGGPAVVAAEPGASSPR